MTATLSITDHDNDHCPACGKQFSRLTAPPPEEIAAVIADVAAWKQRRNVPAWGQYDIDTLIDRAEAALRSQAAEVERYFEIYHELEKVTATQYQCIRELEDELGKIADFIEPHWHGADLKLEAEWIIEAFMQLDNEVSELESERDAIRKNTIEECAGIAELDGDFLSEQALRIVTAIRALPASEAKITE